MPTPAETPKHKPFGDATSSVHYPREREIDVKHMVLDLAFDWEKRWVGGDVTIRLAPLARPIETVALDSADLRIKTVVSEGTSLSFRVVGHRLLVDLGRSAPVGEDLTLTVSYEARPRRGLYFVGPDRGYPNKPKMIYSQGQDEDNHWWFPCYDYPNDRTTFEQFLTVPSNFTALGNGRLVEVRKIPGDATRTFHYLQEIPAVTYLVSVAIGEFDIVKQDYDGIPVEYYVPKGTPKETTLLSFGLTPDMMKFFSEKIGVRYPYAKYAQSAMVDFIYGGMENISATTQTFETLHPADVEKEASSVGLVAHELAHQWWGDLLTCRDWSHAWLNEGFATYFDALYHEHHFGPDEFQIQMLDDARAYMKEDEQDYRRPIVTNRYTDPFDLFDSHLYPKGGWTLHMLRGVVGDDLFWKSIRLYAAAHQAGLVVTEDLRKAFEETTGNSLDWFFEEWYLRGGHPEFKVGQEWDEKGKRVRLTVEQKQELDDVTPLFRMPVKIGFEGEGGTWEFTVTVARAKEEFTFPLPAPPKMTRFDAGYHLLKTLEFPRTLDELAYQITHDPDVTGRIWAADQLGAKTLDDEAARALASAISKEAFWGVRLEIAKNLGKIRVPESREALIRALKDEDTRVRASALLGLGKFREDVTAAGAIRSAFRSEKNVFVRAAAVKAYAAARAPDAFALLKEASGIPAYRDVIAIGAYEGMEDLNDLRAVPLLREGARYGRPRRQRESAIRTLGKLARGDGKREVVDFLLQMLQDPWIFARGAAISALGDAGDEKAIAALLDASTGEVDARLRKGARQAVASIRNASAAASDLNTLRTRLDQLQDETRGLTHRLESIEREKGKTDR